MVPLTSGNLVTYIPDSPNGIIEIWDPKTGNPMSFLGEANTGEGVRSILELSDSKLMAAYQNGQIKVWDLSENQLAQELSDYFFQLGSKSQLTDKKLVRFEDGAIAFPSRNHTIKIIDSQTFQPIKTLSNLSNGDLQEIRSLIPLRDRKLAVVRIQQIEIWDLQQGSVMKVFQTPEENRVLELIDGRLAFFEQLENEPKLLKTWNPKTNEIRNIGSGFIPRYYDLVELPENRLMTVAYDYDKAVIWDLAAQKPLRTIHETHLKKFSAVLLDANQWVLTEQKYSGRLTSLKIFDPWRDIRKILDEIYREM